MSRDLTLYQKLYESTKPLSEIIAGDIAGLNVRSLIEDLIMRANLAEPDGKVVHELATPRSNLAGELSLLKRRKYPDLTFQELKERDPEMYYKLMFDFWSIKENEKVRKIMVF